MATDKKTTANATADFWLRTEGPLCEKDEQARTVEQHRKLQQEAGKRWSALHEQPDKNLPA